MDTPKKKKFRLNNPKELDFLTLPDEMFQSATEEEKSSVVEVRKSVSYWGDAFRRFRANKVAMVALLVFAFIFLFAFLGPVAVPYSYRSQYRAALKLGPMEYSEAEQMEQLMLEDYDKIFYTEMMVGSMQALKKGDYFITEDGTTYYFSFSKSLKNAMILYEKEGTQHLYIARDSSYEEGIGYTEIEPLEYTVGETVEGAEEIEMISGVFPHLLGTDSAGRDLMARCMYGTRVSLIIGIVAALIVLVIGSLIGSIAGLCGGAVDFVIMRIIDLIISVPTTLMVLLLQVVLSDPLQSWFDHSNMPLAKSLGDLGVGIVSIFIIFALLYWVSMARIVRGQVLQLKSMEFITAEKVLGARNKRIVTRHLLPNCVGQLVIATCLQIPSAIFLESFLSYLGIGVAAPMASLGSLCSDALGSLTLYPYRLIFPALILSILVLSLNLIGDGLRDALDPRLK